MNRSLTIGLLMLAFAASGRADDVELLHAQFLAYYTAAGGDPAAPRMQRALGELESVARQITGPDWFRASDGSWYDIDYGGKAGADWGPWSHSRRLLFLAKAYRTPGQGLYRDPTLRAHIDAALKQTLKFYGPFVFPSGNWWFWTIGIPIDLGPTLVLMQGDVDSGTFSDLRFAMRLRIGDSPTGRGIVGPVPTGQNLVWSSFTHLCHALIQRDVNALAKVRDAMDGVVLPATGEGIKPDSSFHQHGAQLYTGGYGGSFANDVARHALITRGTPYGLSPASLTSFSDYVADGIAWSLHGDYFDVSVISREVSRRSTSGYNGMAALVQAAQIATPRTNEIRSAAAKILETWNGTMPSEIAGAASRIDAATRAAWPLGHRHFFASDYTVHRRTGWFASIKMFSTRTRSGENTNNENLLGSRQSDGRFYLVLRGNEYFGRDVWPVLDWTRLPGTTVELKPDAANAMYGYGSRTFAGGSGDGRNGVSAMELAPINSVLSARKAWVFFDDAIVFLTNGVTSSSTNAVETIVNQWALLDPASQVVRRDAWMTLEQVGYWFPSPNSLRIVRASRTGTWAMLGASTDTATRTKEVVTISVDHGRMPMNDTAEYVVVPNVSPQAMADWTASRPLSILANNDVVSAARDNRTGALGITFWRAGSIAGVQSSAAAVIYVVPDGNTLLVHAADPNGGSSGSFDVIVPGSWTTNDVPSTRTGSGTSLTIPHNGGRTTSVTLNRVSTRRRATAPR